MATVFWRLFSLDLHNTPSCDFLVVLIYSIHFSIVVSLLSTYFVLFIFLVLTIPFSSFIIGTSETVTLT